MKVLRYVDAFVSKAVSSPVDGMPTKADKVRLFYFNVLMLFLTTIYTITVAADSATDNRGYLTAALGLGVLMVIISICMQVVSKLLKASLFTTTISVMLAQLWCGAALGFYKQGAIVVCCVVCLTGAPCLVTPTIEDSGTHSLLLAIGAVFGFVTVSVITSLEVVVAQPVGEAEFFVILSCTALGVFTMIGSFAAQQRRFSHDRVRLWDGQKKLEERLAFALEQVRLPLKDLEMAAASEHPPHPTVTLAAQALQAATDDFQSVVGFHVSYINDQPFVVRQSVAFAVAEIQAFVNHQRSKGTRRDRSEHGVDRISEGQINFMVNVSSAVPVTMYGDGRRFIEIIVECLFNASRRAVYDVYMSVQIREGLMLHVRIGDDGSVWDEHQKNKLLKPRKSRNGDYTRFEPEVGLPRCRRLLEMMGGSLALTEVLGRYISVSEFLADPASEYNAIDIMLPLVAPKLPSIFATEEEKTVRDTTIHAAEDHYFSPAGARKKPPTSASELLQKHFPVDVEESRIAAHKQLRQWQKDNALRKKDRYNHRILTGKVDVGVDDDGSVGESIVEDVPASASVMPTNWHNYEQVPAQRSTFGDAEQWYAVSNSFAPRGTSPNSSRGLSVPLLVNEEPVPPVTLLEAKNDVNTTQWWPPPQGSKAPEESPITRLNESVAIMQQRNNDPSREIMASGRVRPEDWAHL